MYKVLIVDDDVAVLTFLSTMIPWEKYGFVLMGACTNAEDALENSRVGLPDLVLTDIGMPGMDGIEFIKVLKAISQHPRFIILSCHDDFKFAKQAVQLGVQDYILKETLSIEILEEILERMYGSIEAEDRLQQKVEKLHFQALQSKSALREQWLRDFLTTPFTDHLKWRNELVEYGLKPDLEYYIPAVCSVSLQDALTRYMNEDVVKFIIYNAVEELLQQEPDVVCFTYTAKEFCLLFAFRQGLKMKPYEWVTGVCQDLQRSVAKILKIQISLFIGKVNEECSEVRHQFMRLLQATDVFFYSKAPEIIQSQQIMQLSGQEELLPYYSQFTDEVNHLIVEVNKDVRPVVETFIEFITLRRFRPIIVKYFLIKLVLDIQMKLTFSQQYNNVKVQQHLEQMDNIIQLKEWMIGFLEEAVSTMEQISTESKKVEIIDAQKYIYLNMDQKITLGDVAERLYLNSSYFSRLFKKETGENFIEYVNRVKMERAKELLNTSDKTIEDIAQSLGYDNKGYFVKLFKSHYGVPPSRYV